MDTSTAVVATQQRLANKVVIITGGASGIGESAVRIFVENGAKVVIADIQDAKGQALAEKFDGNVVYIHCDVSNEEDVINLVDATVAKFGKVDVMYNNAGVVDAPLATILETPKSEVERLIGVNLVGGFLGAKHAARVMVPRGQGCILFTASACTAIGGLASPAYAVTKHGIAGLVKNLAAELGQFGIRVNCVSPLGVLTPMTEVSADVMPHVEEILSSANNLKGQILQPDDVARAALFLASEEANFVSGVNLVVDGGFSVVNPTFINMKASFISSNM